MNFTGTWRALLCLVALAACFYAEAGRPRSEKSIQNAAKHSVSKGTPDAAHSAGRGGARARALMISASPKSASSMVNIAGGKEEPGGEEHGGEEGGEQEEEGGEQGGEQAEEPEGEEPGGEEQGGEEQGGEEGGGGEEGEEAESREGPEEEEKQREEGEEAEKEEEPEGEVVVDDTVKDLAANNGEDMDDMVKAADGSENPVVAGMDISEHTEDNIEEEMDLMPFGVQMFVWLCLACLGVFLITKMNQKLAKPEIGVASILCCLYCWSVGGFLVFLYPIDETPLGGEPVMVTGDTAAVPPAGGAPAAPAAAAAATTGA